MVFLKVTGPNLKSTFSIYRNLDDVGIDMYSTYHFLILCEGRKPNPLFGNFQLENAIHFQEDFLFSEIQ